MSLFASLRQDIEAARQRDPAAISTLEIILAYPGFHARQLHRLAHTLHARHISREHLLRAGYIDSHVSVTSRRSMA